MTTLRVIGNKEIHDELLVDPSAIMIGRRIVLNKRVFFASKIGIVLR